MTEKPDRKYRLLVIDECKIIGILAIVGWHIFGGNLNIEYISIPFRDLGLILFIIASGMGLAYSTPEITTLQELKDFYAKRFFRIYPIYWLVVLILLIWASSSYQFRLPTWDALQWFQTFFGFQAFVGDFGGRLSVTFWFVGLIVSLYILYPFMLWAHNRNKHYALIGFFLISVISTYFVSQWTTMEYSTLWFPLCRVFEFGLGIYLISIIDPVKIAYNNSFLILLADLAFYIYLIHYPLIGTLRPFGDLALPAYIVMTFTAAYILYRIDGLFQAAINRYILKLHATVPVLDPNPGKDRRKRK